MTSNNINHKWFALSVNIKLDYLLTGRKSYGLQNLLDTYILNVIYLMLLLLTLDIC